jgi:hypothetical protein
MESPRCVTASTFVVYASKRDRAMTCAGLAVARGEKEQGAGLGWAGLAFKAGRVSVYKAKKE